MKKKLLEPNSFERLCMLKWIQHSSSTINTIWNLKRGGFNSFEIFKMFKIAKPWKERYRKSRAGCICDILKNKDGSPYKCTCGQKPKDPDPESWSKYK